MPTPTKSRKNKTAPRKTHPEPEMISPFVSQPELTQDHLLPVVSRIAIRIQDHAAGLNLNTYATNKTSALQILQRLDLDSCTVELCPRQVPVSEL